MTRVKKPLEARISTRMDKAFLKRWLPTREHIGQIRSLQFLGHWLHEPSLWRINRRSVSGAFGVGLFWALIPVPFQMVFAAATATVVKANIPISMALVWLTNPITMPPIFYATYRFGSWLLQQPPVAYPEHWSASWMLEQMADISSALYLGSLITALVAAALSFFAVRLLWRLRIHRQWRARRANSHSRTKHPSSSRQT